MLALKSRILFRIGRWNIHISNIEYLLDDFSECHANDLSAEDSKELTKLRQDYSLIRHSYLYDRIRPFALPFRHRLIPPY